LIALALANHCKLAFAPLDSGAEALELCIALSKLDTIDFDDFYCFIPSKKMVIWRVYPIVRHNTS